MLAWFHIRHYSDGMDYNQSHHRQLERADDNLLSPKKMKHLLIMLLKLRLDFRHKWVNLAVGGSPGFGSTIEKISAMDKRGYEYE